jgi:thiol:disulfide interchange protein DsbC
MLKNLALALGFAFAAATAAAQTPEALIKKNVETALGDGSKVESVRKAGALNLYEVVIGGDILYTDEKASYLLIGHLFDTKNRKDLTQERLDKLAQIKFSDLPLELAIKQVRGNGKRRLATFEDPNCTYCKRLAKELQGLNDVTLYTFLYPILSPDSTEKAKGIWCSSDRAKAWNDFMINGSAPAPASMACDTSAIEKVIAAARRLNIRGTPAIFFADGNRVPGFIPLARLEEAMAKADKNM